MRQLDDDVFVHIPRVLSFLSAPNSPKEKLYADNHYRNNQVFREGKWKVPYEEHNEIGYPDGLSRLWTLYLTTLFVHLLTRSHLLRSFDWTMCTLAC